MGGCRIDRFMLEACKFEAAMTGNDLDWWTGSGLIFLCPVFCVKLVVLLCGKAGIREGLVR